MGPIYRCGLCGNELDPDERIVKEVMGSKGPVIFPVEPICQCQGEVGGVTMSRIFPVEGPFGGEGPFTNA